MNLNITHFLIYFLSAVLLPFAVMGGEFTDAAAEQDKSIGDVLQRLRVIREKQGDSGVFEASELTRADGNIFGISFVKDKYMPEILRALSLSMEFLRADSPVVLSVRIPWLLSVLEDYSCA